MAAASSDVDSRRLEVLQLTNAESPFFGSQLEGLSTAGVDSTVVSMGGAGRGWSPRDYLDLYVDTLDASRDGFDVLHANYGLVGPLGLAQPTRPAVLTLWGSEVMRDLGTAGWVTRLSTLSARGYDAVVAPSEALDRAVPCETEVVPFGVDTERFRPIDRERARERLGWDRDERVVLFPYDPSREVKDFPRARRVVERSAVDATLRPVHGVDHAEVPHYMNAADAVLLTSRREAGPMVVKEAAACNVPVVATDVGFVDETLADVSNSWVCTDDDELVAGLEAALASGGRSDGREAVDVLSLAEMGARLRGVYEDVLADD